MDHTSGGEGYDLPMYDANVRVMAQMLQGISEFALDLASQGRITPDEVEGLAQSLILPASEGESGALADTREQWEHWIVDMLAGVRVLARAAARDQP